MNVTPRGPSPRLASGSAAGVVAEATGAVRASLVAGAAGTSFPTALKEKLGGLGMSHRQSQTAPGRERLRDGPCPGGCVNSSSFFLDN